MKELKEMKELRWSTSAEDADLIDKIASRAFREFGSETLLVAMDLTVCHLNGHPLDLPRLLAFPLGDFGHDVNGIRRHLDRQTGELTGGFQPRSSL